MLLHVINEIVGSEDALEQKLDIKSEIKAL